MMEHYSALKRKDLLSRVATWKNLEDIVLKAVSQSLKNKHYDSTYMRPRAMKCRETEMRMAVARA